MPIPYEWRDKIDAWIRKMGYHFVLKSFACPDEIGGALDAKVEIENAVT